MEAEGRAKQETINAQVGGRLDAVLDTEKKGERTEHGLRIWGLEKKETGATPDRGSARSWGAGLAQDVLNVGTRGHLT